MPFQKPETKFTRAGDVAIAYQVVGEGPVDLIYISGWLHNIDIVWEHPGYRAFLEELAQKCRLILFDKRGTGMSDRDVGAPTLEERAEDIRAVMAAAGSERAAIFGISEGGAMTAMFAACYPEKVSAIVMFGSFPCKAWKPDWPHGMRRGDFQEFIKKLETQWGNLGYILEARAPSVCHDPEERAYFNKLFVQSASPKSALALTSLNYEIDYRSILPTISVPALVLHPENDLTVTAQEARYIADNIPDGRFEIMPGMDHLPWVNDTTEIARKITDFVCEAPGEVREDRMLSTILVTDIEGSTAASAERGDAAWLKMLRTHDELAKREIARHDGTFVGSTGDGILATFQGPSRAVQCAQSFGAELSNHGLKMRSGVHTGECLRRDQDVTGMAVVIANRIMAQVPGGEVWVSGTVRDLTVGSGIEFEPLGSFELKGVPDVWPLYRAGAT